MAKNIFLKATIRALRHLTSLLLCILLICPITSCKKTDIACTNKSPHNENILRYDVNAPFTSLNPTEVKASGSNHIFPLLYSYLFVPNTEGELKGDLATSWGYDRKNIAWTIRLRKDAVFHNGQPVTSKDIRYSLEAHLAHISTPMSSLIDRVSVLSDTRLSIHLKRDDPGFPEKIWDFEIIPEPNGDKIDYWNHPIGSGPFMFKHRKGEKEVVLVANENYYDGRPSLDGVTFYYEPDRERIWTRLLAGETDIAQEITPKNYEIMRQYETRFYFDRYILNRYTIVLYNTHDPLFSDPKVRLALSHAIDREYIVKEVLNGYGVVAIGPMGVASLYHNPDVRPVLYNPRKSLHLLKEAGWSCDTDGDYLTKDGKEFIFTIFVYAETQIEKRIAQYIKLCLNDIGVNVRLQALPFEEQKKKYLVNNQFQAVITELDSLHRKPEDVQNLWSPIASTRSWAGCFEHPEVTRLIRKALDTKDSSKQRGLFHEIDALITSLQPGTFLFHKAAINVMSKRFALPGPFSLKYSGIHGLRHASLTQ